MSEISAVLTPSQRAARQGDADQLVQRAYEAQQRSGQSRFSRLSRSLRALRYYRKKQVIRRLTNIATRKLSVFKGAATRSPSYGLVWRSLDPDLVRFQTRQRVFNEVANIPSDGADYSRLGRDNRVEDIASGRLTLLNQAVDVGWPFDWSLTAAGYVPHLWRFHLHYHEYLRRMIQLDPADASARATAWSVINDWIDVHQSPTQGAADAWHPYCISRRIPVWLELLALCETEMEQAFVTKVKRSLESQTGHLVRHLEWDLKGNHLLENLKAVLLVVAATTGGESEWWLQDCSKWLRQEVADQLLTWGEHCERSPMYHCHLTANFLELALALDERCPDLSEECAHIGSVMWGFLKAILHPDGEIPLLADSCFGEAPAVAYVRLLLDKIRQRVPRNNNRVTLAGPTCGGGSAGGTKEESSVERTLDAESPACGTLTGPYWIWRRRDHFLLFDGGQTGADHLPAHMHADPLTIEASVGGSRLIVDSGNYNYEDDKLRAYCRSSLAHNVVTVEGHNHAELWSKFRVGARPKVAPLHTGNCGDFEWALGRHHTIPAGSRRAFNRIVLAAKPLIWGCLDWVTMSSSWERSSAHHSKMSPLRGYLHLAPQVVVEPVAEGEYALLLMDRILRLTFVNCGWSEATSGWYCPEFGRRELASVITYKPIAPGASYDQITAEPFGWFLTEFRSQVEVAWCAKNLQSGDSGDECADTTLIDLPDGNALNIRLKMMELS